MGDLARTTSYRYAVVMTSPHVAGHPYQVVAADIVRQIKAGTLKPGEKLPSVRALAKEADVSAMTAQKALNHLAEQGHAEVTAGLGYFVTEQVVSDPVSFESVTQQLDHLQKTVTDLSTRLERLEDHSGER